jgi:hypothetical protein
MPPPGQGLVRFQGFGGEGGIVSNRKGNPAELGVWQACLDSLLGRDLDFYPRVECSDQIITLKTDPMSVELSDTTKPWAALRDDGESLGHALELARQSLDEVKEQTEYQDQKAGRLMTVATILTALSGVLFARFNDSYPLMETFQSADPLRWLVLVSYLLFALFVTHVLFGALVTFHATRTRFKYKEIEKAAHDAGPPTSRLFWKGMIGVRPSAWANAFAGKTGDGTLSLASDLRQQYLRDLVGEAYLVAAKTADKIRYLVPAQTLLARSLVYLVVWLVSLAFVNATVASTTPSSKPIRVEIMSSTAPASVSRQAQMPSLALGNPAELPKALPAPRSNTPETNISDPAAVNHQHAIPRRPAN